ncbi:CU044_5270 family protein [Kitasatospora sp. NPDC051853]|uniref:CU044_5270 family protein n=1 Tax=Kitasatospora sp. NPDC051853 TaxID=3364058 RepID=UPI00379EB321
MNRTQPPSDPSRSLAELLPPPPVPPLGAARGRQLKESVLRSAAPAPAPAPAVAVARPVRRPLLLAGVALACAVTGVVAVQPWQRAAPAPAVVADAPTSAVHLLDRIALVSSGAGAASRPGARADQFVYVESRVAFAGRSADGGPAVLPPVHTRRVWSSADGSRPGLVREDGAPDSVTSYAPGTPVDGTAPSSPSGPSVSNPTPAWLASLPTDPAALLRLIHDQTRGQGGDPDQRAFTAIGDLLAETSAPPQVTAALYRAAALIPGVTVVPSATDAAGREGVAVARTAPSSGAQTQWVFDRVTHHYLGERTVLTTTTDAGPAGTVLGTSAVLTRAVVDRPGDLPAPSAA